MFFDSTRAAAIFENVSDSPETFAVIAIVVGFIAVFWSFYTSRRVNSLWHSILYYTKKLEDTAMWLPILTSRYRIERPLAAEVWLINFESSRHIVQENVFTKNKNGFFEIGTNALQTESVLAPLVRKSLLRFRKDFEKEHPIAIHRSQTGHHMMTWLHNPTQLRLATFRYFEECLTMSDFLQVVPELNIQWNDELTFKVTWKKLEKQFINIFYEKFRAHAELICHIEDDNVSLMLCLAFNEKKLGHHLQRLSTLLKLQNQRLPTAG